MVKFIYINKQAKQKLVIIQKNKIYKYKLVSDSHILAEYERKRLIIPKGFVRIGIMDI